MLFNSVSFAIFLPIVFALYWLLGQKSIKLQNFLLLASSYFFYASWNYKFLFLLIFSTLLDFFTGIKIYEAQNQHKKKFWLWLSIITNLGFLGVFKYYNFFATSFAETASLLGLRLQVWTLKVLLPVGISFYTFHGLSYVIDIYKERLKPVRNFIEYSVFVSFFPLLVAGPIERANHLLPQIQKPRDFSCAKAVNGLRQILWGLFKKIVIADNCAVYANMIFNNASNYSGSTLVLGALFFTFQIYCDFSGYSDIALGTARLFGIDLLRNFAFPYFSRDIAEFWRRWHMSLSSWFRDYVYIPLGGSKGGTWMKVRNTFIIFLLSGLWHGANWTFIAWGALNALYFLPLLLRNKNRQNLDIVAEDTIVPSFKEIVAMIKTFGLVVFAWIFFRSENINHALGYISRIFSSSIFSIPLFPARRKALVTIFTIIIFMIVEWFGRDKKFAVEKIGHTWNRTFRWAFYYVIIVAIILLQGIEQQFIYFQF